MKAKKRKMIRTWEDKLLYGLSSAILLVVLIAVAYPLIYVISASISSANALSAGRVLLWPVDITADGYRFVMQYKSVWLGYRNTLIYTVMGVTVTMVLLVLFSYPLSRKDYQGRKLMTIVFTVAMMSSPGLIPNFLARVNLGLYGSPLAVAFQSALNLSGVMILRTAFNSVPEELYEAAEIDGAGQFWRLFKVGIPLVKASLGVLFLYAVVGCWNDYFSAMIYLPDPKMHPLALVLRSILTAAQTIDTSSVSSAEVLALVRNGTEQVKYVLIIISTVPVLILYATVQKCFKGGAMIGAVKG